MRKGQTRPALPHDVQAKVLARSRRRCSLCFGLDFDLSYKTIQIAHVDQNPRNNAEDNLAALCQFHHDEYDCVRRQTKGITPAELRRHRASLYSVLEEKDRRVTLQFLESGSNDPKVTSSSSLLLGQIAAAFDEDSERKASGATSNGIRLAELARQAMKLHGDFPAVLQAFKLLTHLVTDDLFELVLFGQTSLPIASPTSNVAALLKEACDFDFNLFISLVGEAYDQACFPGHSQAKFWEATATFPPEFIPIGCLLCGLCGVVRPLPSWGQEWVVRIVGSMISGISMCLAMKGFALPPPPTEIVFTTTVRRYIDVEACVPFARLAHRIAQLPEKAFQEIVSNLQFRLPMSNAQYEIDPAAHFASSDEVLNFIRAWALNSTAGLLIGPIFVRNETTVNTCRRFTAELVELGTTTILAAKKWILAERALLLARR